MTTTTTTTSSAGKASTKEKPKSLRKGRRNKKIKAEKTKITKEERRAKYTAIAREREEKRRNKDVICYRCRKKGHAVTHCPEAAAVGEDDNKKKSKKSVKKKSAVVANICYKCGSTEHALASCPKRKKDNDDTLPYATCFICQEMGHLASRCPQNDHGIYVKGGACKECGSKLHRAKECPEKQKKKQKEKDTLPDVDFSDLLADATDEAKAKKQTPSKNKDEKSEEKRAKKASKKRVVKF